MEGLKVAEMDLDTPECCANTYENLIYYRSKTHYELLYDTAIITQRFIVINRMHNLYNKLQSLEKVVKDVDTQLCEDSIEIQSTHTDHKFTIFVFNLETDLSTFYVDIRSSNDDDDDDDVITNVDTFETLIDYIQKWKKFAEISNSWKSEKTGSQRSKKKKRLSRGPKGYDQTKVAICSQSTYNVDEFIKNLISN